MVEIYHMIEPRLLVSAPVRLPEQLCARLHVGATDTQTPRRQTSIANIDTRLSGCYTRTNIYGELGDPG